MAITDVWHPCGYVTLHGGDASQSNSISIQELLLHWISLGIDKRTMLPRDPFARSSVADEVIEKF